MPTYAKFMKDIFTKKMRYTDQETINLDVICSSIVQRTIPHKEIEPMRVTLPVTIGNVNIGKTLVDLDKSITRPSGIAEDALVKMDKFLFPIDFFMMDIEEDDDALLILDPETPLEAFILKEEMEINTFSKKIKGIERIYEKAKTFKKAIHDVVKRARPIKRNDKTKTHDGDVDDWIISQRPP
ncbi:uncharacterized protein LOC127135983 [Lathyrus oleraceus]|uniref:uncharacterized protein LOC127135983 n=1 Tax=Pisum sativum TaxID=3888 RepID=UPI0021D15462|nr:uncharacterized protein LOC127135983 [Pisum sativum]